MSTSLTFAPMSAQVLGVESAEPSPIKKRLSGLEERREARVRAAVGGGGDSDSAEPQAAVTGRRALIGREMLVYLAEQGQLAVDAFNLLGFWNRWGTDSVCPTPSTVTSLAEMPYLAFIARLYNEIKATSRVIFSSARPMPSINMPASYQWWVWEKRGTH